MRHGRRYTTPFDVGTKREALAELALFDRDKRNGAPLRERARAGDLRRIDAADAAVAEATITAQPIPGSPPAAQRAG
jgi:hypothetical protein